MSQWQIFKYNDRDTYPSENKDYNIYIVGIDRFGYIQCGYSISHFILKNNTPVWTTLDEVFAYTPLTPEQEIETEYNKKVDLAPSIFQDSLYNEIKIPIYKKIFSLIDNYCNLSKNTDEELYQIWRQLIENYTVNEDFFKNNFINVFAEYQSEFVNYRKKKGGK